MHIREPNVAGQFYPADKDVLTAELERCFREAKEARHELRGIGIKALIAPHAGYVYSGATAASAYQLLKRAYRRIVVLGPSHYVGFNSVALDETEAWRSPLGEVALDHEALSALSRSEYFKVLPEAFAREHSLEVQIPFLQKQQKSFTPSPERYGRKTVDEWQVNRRNAGQCHGRKPVVTGFTLVPLCCGQELASQSAAMALNKIIDGDTLVVASSDLSHYQPQQIAEKRDHKTISAILSRDQERLIMDMDACGSEGILILNELARFNNWQPYLADYRTSADASGDESAVVGYASIVYCR